jgi:hypothetical protein
MKTFLRKTGDFLAAQSWPGRDTILARLEAADSIRHNLLKELKPGGHLIIDTFAPEAPAKCNGLPVQRYNPEQLEITPDEEFELVRHHNELHITPGGVEQTYCYCQFHKTV